MCVRINILSYKELTLDFSSVGIVLRKSSSSRNKIALIDKQYGRIECIVNALDKSVGTLLSYTMSNRRDSFFLRDIDSLHTPLSLGSSDLLFLHHIFELIYYFAPVGSCVGGVFDLLAFLYTIEHMLISMRFKKFFLFKLLTLLGVAPEIESLRSLCIAQLKTIAVDRFDETMIDKEAEKKLDKWLWCCVLQHPYANEFKTVHFLEKNRMI